MKIVYIPEFVVGIVSTLLVELIMLIIYAASHNKKR